MSQKIHTTETVFMERIQKSSRLSITMGTIILLVGLLAIGSPFIAGLSLTMLVGVILILGGIGQLVFAVTASRDAFSITLGILSIIIGGYMVSNPSAALSSLTIFLTIYLVVSGIVEVLMSFQLRPASGWAWTLFSGFVAVLLGVMIWSQFPLSGAWAIGVLIGIRLLFSGWALLMFGFAARGAAKELTQAT